MSEMSITVTFPTRTYVREADGYYARRDDGGLIDCHTDSDVVWALDKAAALQQDLAAARAEVERLTKERNEAIVKLSLCKIGREEAQRDLAAVRKALEGLVGETEADALRQMEQVLAAVPHHPEQGVTLAAVRTLLTLAAQEGA